MTQKDNKENEIGKFPVNSGSLAGVITRVSFNEKEHRANVTLMVSKGPQTEHPTYEISENEINKEKVTTIITRFKGNESSQEFKGEKAKEKVAEIRKAQEEQKSVSSQFINVLVSGKERFTNFKTNYEHAFTELGFDDNNKKILPAMFVTGQANFSSSTQENGPTHQNFSLIATSDMKENTEKYQLTANKTELDKFRTEFNSKNPIINQINIRGRISNDPKHIEAANGTFQKLSIAHNYIVNDETTKVMYANVIIPGSLSTQVKQSQPEKGVAILLSGKIQPISYMKGEQKVHSFNIVTTSLQRDLTNTTTVKKAAEGIDKVANVANKKDRLNEAEVQKDGLKR
jgi:hypothetical protein